MRPDEWPQIILTEEHRAKICLDFICEFLNQRPDDVFMNMDKPNMSVKDYSLEQFQRRIWKKIPHNTHPRNKKLERKIIELRKREDFYY